jgi:hypothetical protein
MHACASHEHTRIMCASHHIHAVVNIYMQGLWAFRNHPQMALKSILNPLPIQPTWYTSVSFITCNALLAALGAR